MELIERAAEALESRIAEITGEAPIGPFASQEAVCAVLRAIREPSKAMERAGYGNSKGDPDYTGIVDNPDPIVAWQAMIDAALAE